MRAYARQARNKLLEVDAAEIRMRAERRLGEMIAAAKSAGQLSEGRPRKTVGGSDSLRTTLRDAEITRDLSSRAQKLAAVPHEQFEGMMGEWRVRSGPVLFLPIRKEYSA